MDGDSNLMCSRVGEYAREKGDADLGLDVLVETIWLYLERCDDAFQVHRIWVTTIRESIIVRCTLKVLSMSSRIVYDLYQGGEQHL